MDAPQEDISLLRTSACLFGKKRKMQTNLVLKEICGLTHLHVHTFRHTYQMPLVFEVLCSEETLSLRIGCIS